MKRKYFFLLLTLFILFVIDVLVGRIPISCSDIFYYFFSYDYLPATQYFIIQQRILNVNTAVLACGALSLAGLSLQALFRNYLAGPSILGISSGGILGMAIFTFLIQTFSIQIQSVIHPSIFFSIGGSCFILLILLFINTRIYSTQMLLIIGIMLSFISSAFIDILKFYFDRYQLQLFSIWNMASFSNTTKNDIYILLLFIAISFLIMITMAKKFDVYELGDDMARGMGININNFKTKILVITGVLVGITTALCGPIAFVGLVVPQLVKIFRLSLYHIGLIPSTFLLGGIFGLLADLLSKIVFIPHIIPINSITSLLGIPVLIWILYKNKEIA